MGRFVFLVLVLAVVGIGAFLLTLPETISPLVLHEHTADLRNGETMFNAGGCASCHAKPKQEDKTKLGGGLALASPFGTFYVPNISPHPTDGIGNWTEAQFVTALVKGTSPNGRHYYPAFPYTTYQHAKFGDLRDLFAYLKTLPPVEGKVRGPDLRFPYDMRAGLGFWKLLYLDGTSLVADPNKSTAWNRGDYLVNALAHCAECHSPRNFLGGIVESQRFAGGPAADGKGWAPNITQKGIGDWSEKDIAYLLETGNTPDGDSVGGEMTAVVANTAKLDPDDRAAIAAYIKSLPPVVGPKPPEKKK